MNYYSTTDGWTDFQPAETKQLQQNMWQYEIRPLINQKNPTPKKSSFSSSHCKQTSKSKRSSAENIDRKNKNKINSNL